MMKDRQNDDENDIIDETGKTRRNPFDITSDDITCKELGGFDFEAWREPCKSFKISQISHWKDLNTKE